MVATPLAGVPAHSFVVIDANILIYGLNGLSVECGQFLHRCLQEEVTGIALFETVNEVTHRLMIAEALSRSLITRASAHQLRTRSTLIPSLSDYWRTVERLLALNLLFVPVDEAIVRGAHGERRSASLLTNDSMIISCMRAYGISALASNDSDFERVTGINLYKPTDLI